MFGVVDRFEGNAVIIEDDSGNFHEIKRHLLPEDLQEGDVLDLKTLKVDKRETQSRQAYVEKLVKDLFEDDN